MRIGIFGGTFDPIHLGHLIVAESVRVQLGLGKIIFVPAGDPWLKSEREITNGERRYEMVQLAIESNPYFEISRMELDRPGPSYTVDTMYELKRTLGEEYSLYFIAGPDALATFHRWKEPERLVRMCSIVAVKRPGVESIDLSAMESRVPGVSRRIKEIDVPLIGISSTDIREKVKTGLSIRYLLPREVEDYISQHRLYKA